MGLLKSALCCDDPVVYMEHKNLWALEGEVDDRSSIPLGVARTAREGKDLTIVSWSSTYHEAMLAAVALGEEGIDAEVIDLRTLWPWDKTAVLNSVEKTGRLLVAHEAVQVAGFGAEIVATVVERAFSSLRAPIRRIGAPRVPIPYAPPLEDLLRVTSESIGSAARELMR
jgi:pyruvate dehydrogenase E1 component beta subunit